MTSRSQKNVYLDYAAATPVSRPVQKAMQPFFSGTYGNPSSLHGQGQKAKAALELSRKIIANTISAQPGEVVYTAGGTESCNLAIFGLSKSLGKKRGHFITSAVEHAAVMQPLLELEKQGHSLTILKTDSKGFVSIQELQKSVRPETVLVSIMYANNEIGTIQPVPAIARLLKKLNQQREGKKLPKIYFHTDGCQAAGLCDLSVSYLGVDLMSVNGGKIYGPKQSGFLFIKTGTPVVPIILGGGQERGRRSGTENVAFAVGLAKALELAQQNRKKEAFRLASLQSLFCKTLQNKIPKLILNGPELDSEGRLVNNLNFTLPGIEGETMLLYLDAQGISVSTGSACSSNANQPSHVLRALGLSAHQVKNNLRISFGHETNQTDLKYFVKIFALLVKQLQKVVSQV